MSMVRLPNGKTARRCLSINEIIGYDSATDSFSFVEAFRWNPLDDTFEFRGYMNSYLMEEKIAPRRGIPYTKKRTIYQLIEQRANILERIHERKVTNFYALYNTLTKAYREGYFR
jgi:flagellar protein FlaI